MSLLHDLLTLHDFSKGSAGDTLHVPQPAQTVRQAVEQTAAPAWAEIALFCDPEDGVWCAHPVGGLWEENDEALPICTGSDPVAVIRELLRSPALNPAGKEGK